MKDNKPHTRQDTADRKLFATLRLVRSGALAVLAAVIGLLIYLPHHSTIDVTLAGLSSAGETVEAAAATDEVIEGVHTATGLAYDQDFELVRGACTSCHSAQLITQNRATKEGWQEMIVWMQKTQGLPDLGAAEATIVDYLARHYAPEAVGRRPPLALSEDDWYELDIQK